MHRIPRSTLVIALSLACKPASNSNDPAAATDTGVGTTVSTGSAGPGSTVTVTTTDQSTDHDHVGAGNIALITNPSEILTTIDGAVQSTFAGNLTDDGTRAPISFAPGQLAVGLALQGTNVEDECATSAVPRPSGSTSPDQELPRSDPDFAAGRFYCLLRFNTFAPNSVQGAYYQNKAFLCDLNRQGALVEGDTRTAKLDFSDKTCYSDRFREMSFSEGVPPPIDIQVKYERPSKIAPDEWDSSVTILLPPDMGNLEIVVLSKTTDTGLSTGAIVGHTSYILSYDVAGGVLRIDQQSKPNPMKGSDTNYTHYRMFAQGEIDANLQFTSLSKFAGIDSISYEMSGSRNAALASFNMDFAVGGLAFARQCTSNCTTLANYTANSARATCYAGDDGVESCTGITPITPSSDAALAFTLIPGTNAPTDAGQQLLDRGPLTFDTVSFSVFEP